MNQIFRVERRDATVIVWIDDPARSVNTITEAFVEQLDALLTELEEDASARGVVFCSGKPDFLLGADLERLRERLPAAAGEALARRTQALFDRLAGLATPTAAAIRGKCLGGGLELALACDLRIAVDDRDCELGQTEIKLGLLPGAGGTQRLPRIVGLVRALELLLSGARIGASEALEDGLVDLVVPEAILVEVARERVAALEVGAGRRAGLRETGSWSRAQARAHALLERVRGLLVKDNPFGRILVFDQARKRAQAKTRGNLPAVDRILDVVRVGLEQGHEAGLEAEARAFGELVASAESAELVRLFFVGRQLDHEAEQIAGEVSSPARIGIIGAGMMGAGIAELSAAAGLRVRLFDQDPDELGHGLWRVREAVDARRGLTDFDRRVNMARIGPTLRPADLGRCPLIIEAAYEQLAIKRELLGRVEVLGHDDQIFASNTSAIPISQIAAGSSRPQQVVGMHYFSPVANMPLVEVVVGERTDPEVVATCVALARRQGKKVIVVNDGVGFYTTRILAAYLAEAFSLLGRGAMIEAIDEALLDWGFAIGPLKLCDRLGLELGAEIGELMSELGPRFEDGGTLLRLVEDGFEGRAGEGLYTEGGEVNPRVYESLGVRPDPELMAAEDLALRCAFRMIDEAVRCLDEGILRSARDGDAGAVFGLGYPAFRGGPFRTIETMGAALVREELLRLRLPIADGLAAMARERERQVDASAAE